VIAISSVNQSIELSEDILTAPCINLVPSRLLFNK